MEEVPCYVCGRCGLGELDESGEGWVTDTDTVATPLDRATLAKLVELGVDRSMQHALRESIAARERLAVLRGSDPQAQDSRVSSPSISAESSG